MEEVIDFFALDFDCKTHTDGTVKLRNKCVQDKIEEIVISANRMKKDLNRMIECGTFRRLLCDKIGIGSFIKTL